jgi:hypothetical protein
MRVSILTLPPELLDNIAKRCNYASTLALRYTCRELYMKITTSRSTAEAKNATGNKSYSMCDLLEIEKWPCYDFAGGAEDHLKRALATRDFFACSYCLKIRCASKFSNAMMKGKRGKHSPISSDRHERCSRFCIDCGVAHGRYPPGVHFDFGGAPDGLGGGHGVVCYGCRKFRRIYTGLGYGVRRCQACLAAARRP